jgi:MOSC domain-containing protein YiiM
VRIHSIQVGLPATLEHPAPIDGQSPRWHTAYYKHPVAGPVWVSATHLAGDGQADLRNHGGVDKAINVYCLKHYEFWRKLYGLESLAPASFGENLTLDDADEADVCVGDVYAVGEARLQVSQPRQPCWKMCRFFNLLDIAFVMEQNGKTGWYFRVLKEGSVQAGDTLQLLERPQPRWTILAANEVMHRRHNDPAVAFELAHVQQLSQSWKDPLLRRARP